MSKTKFTPGPWEAFNRHTCQFIYAKGYERAICQVDSYSKGFGPDRDERDANARMIAAAPELYDALIAADGLLRDLGHSLPQVKAAIAKARGEPHPSGGDRHGE